MPLTVFALSSAPVLAALLLTHPGHEPPMETRPAAISAAPVALAAAVGTLGQGEFTYVPDADWPQLPDDVTLGNTHGGIVIDPEGRVCFNTDTARSIVKIGADGAFVEAVANRYPGLHNMQIVDEPDGTFIYAAHLFGKQAVKLRLDGSLVWAIGVPMESGRYANAEQFNPTAVVRGPDGRIYVADGYGQNWIHIFNPDLSYASSFGGRGGEPGQFVTCHGLAIDPRGDEPRLLVCDRENRRLQHFDFDGNPLGVIATDLRRPCSVSFWGEYVAVAELEGRVTILDGDNEVVTHLGDNPERGQWANNGVPVEAWTPGVFTAPHAVCFDDAGNLYVMDWNRSGRMSRLVRTPE